MSYEAILQKCSFDDIISEAHNRSNLELHKGEDIKGVKGWESQNYLGLIFLTYLLENESHTFNEAMSSS